MKSGAIVALIIGALALVYLAVSRGLISSGVQVSSTGGVISQRGIVAPQPTQNYSGYLAATTAPGVSGAINGALSGLANAFSSWMSKPPSQNPPVSSPAALPGAQTVASAVGTGVGSIFGGPSLAAAPSGPSIDAVGILPTDISNYDLAALSNVGPVVDPAVSYTATDQAAFDYSGLALDNAYDPSASLETGTAFS